MADNTRGGSQDGSDPLIATDEVTYSGDTADVQLVRVVGVTGAEGSKTVVDPTLPVSGDVAHDAADSGNPVKTGGKANEFRATVTPVVDGDRVDAWFGVYGAQHVVLTDPDGNPVYTNSGHLLVEIPSDAEVATYPATMTGATLSNVAGSASSVTLLASNIERRGATIHNDSSAVLYVKFGTTASTSSFTVKMAADAYYEVPFGYTGRIDGIWASATGNARVTEITS
jgi:hypothetical protein